MNDTRFIAAALASMLIGSGSLLGQATISPPPGTNDPSGINLTSASAFPVSGTGVYGDVFLRLGASPTESGFNSDVINNDVQSQSVHTHDLLLSSLVNSGGFYQISLDINQVQNPSLPNLLLTDLEVFQHNFDNMTQAQFDTLAPVHTLANDYFLPDINNGSGLGDVQIFIPVAGFNPALFTYFTLYAQFSNSNDGFEEFTAVTSQPPPPGQVPEGGTTVLLLGSAFLGLALVRRQFCR